MSVQRRRGQAAIVYPAITVTDNRGNTQLEADLNSPISVVAAFIPDRSARAEVPGQAMVNIVKMLVKPDIPGIDMWARVEWDGRSWDVATPPANHHGSRHTRHTSLMLRQRPG